MPQYPMFLAGIESNPKPGARKDFIDKMKAEGVEYPQLSHLFAFLPEATVHLSRFSQEIMRGDSSLSSGMRELIAAYTSYENDCPF